MRAITRHELEAVIYGLLENLSVAWGLFRRANAAYQLLALAAEHPAGYYFDPPASGLNRNFNFVSHSVSMQCLKA